MNSNKLKTKGRSLPMKDEKDKLSKAPHRFRLDTNNFLKSTLPTEPLKQQTES